MTTGLRDRLGTRSRLLLPHEYSFLLVSKQFVVLRHAVSDAHFGKNVARFVGIWFDLAADARHVNAQDLVVHTGRRPPQLPEESVPFPLTKPRATASDTALANQSVSLTSEKDSPDAKAPGARRQTAVRARMRHRVFFMSMFLSAGFICHYYTTSVL